MDTIGKCKFVDGMEMYYLYQGSSDMCQLHLFKKPELVESSLIKKECICAQQEVVSLTDNYGNSNERHGIACRKCEVITEGFDPNNQMKDVRS